MYRSCPGNRNYQNQNTRSKAKSNNGGRNKNNNTRNHNNVRKQPNNRMKQSLNQQQETGENRQGSTNFTGNGQLMQKNVPRYLSAKQN